MVLFRKFLASLLAILYVASAGVSGCCDIEGVCEAIAGEVRPEKACCCRQSAMEKPSCCASQEGPSCACVHRSDDPAPGEMPHTVVLPQYEKQKLAVHILTESEPLSLYHEILQSVFGEETPPGVSPPLLFTDGKRGPPARG